MKFSYLIIFCFVFIIANYSFAQTSGNIQLTNNGVAPAPAFALGAPAILSSTVIRKNKFYFNPEFNLGIDGKPWTLYSRIGYYLVENKKLTITLTANTNWFFMKKTPIINDEELQVQQYYSFEFNGTYSLLPHQKLLLSYWRSDRMRKVGLLFENFVNLAYEIENIKLGDKNNFSTKPSIFYLEDHGWLSGFFTAQTTTFQRENWKCNLFVTTCWPISQMSGTEFIWNTGVNIPF